MIKFQMNSHNALKNIKKLFRKPEAFKDNFKLKDIPFFIGFVRPLWKMAIFILCLTVLSSAFSAAMPLSGKMFIDFIIMGKDVDSARPMLEAIHVGFLFNPLKYLLGSVNMFLLALLFIGLSGGLFGIMRRLFELQFQQEITYNVQTALYDHLLHVPVSYFKGKQVGYLMSRVSGDVGLLQSFFAQYIPQFLTNIFYSVFSFFILFSLNKMLSFFLLASLPVWVAITLFFAGRVRSVSYSQMERQAAVSKDLQETLSGVDVIKTNVSEKREVEKLSKTLRRLFNTRIKAALLTSLSGYLQRCVKLIITFVVLWISAHEIRQGRMSIGDFVAFLTYMYALTGKASSFSSSFIMLQTIFTGMGRIREIFNLAPEDGTAGDGNRYSKPENIRGSIRFEKVCFRYEQENSVLNNISFQLNAGDIAAIIGASGAGKTSLINLLIKFYQPDQGKIYLDDMDLKAIDTKWLRKQIGFVSQDVFLFNDSIENNIRYGNPKASIQYVVEAARSAQIHEFILSQEHGYQTTVGERGIRLSSGQRQRISIARALLKDPPILIFDEPTSALDAETEKSLFSALKQLARGRTTLIISHRMVFLEIADRIFSLENGSIQEEAMSLQTQDKYLDAQISQRCAYDRA